MIKLHVVVGDEVNEAGEVEEVVEAFEGHAVQFLTEPSGVLLILESADRVWKAYAPGAWRTVMRCAD